MGARRILGYRERQVLDYTREVVANEGIGPSYSMIRRKLGIATQGEVSRIVANLEARGELRRIGRGKVRRIRLHANYQQPSPALSLA